MSLSFQVLGQAGRDNALLVRIDSGQAVSRLLFDCGDGCLGELPFGDIQLIDHLCFSHLHMDHVGGFDTFFRCTFNRTTRPVKESGSACHAWVVRTAMTGVAGSPTPVGFVLEGTMCVSIRGAWFMRKIG